MSNEYDKHERDQYERIGDRVSIFSRNGVWYANWTDSDGKQVRRSLSTSSKKEARLRALKLDAEIEEGHNPRKRKAVSIATAIDAYDDYLVAEGRSKKTLSKYRKVFERIKNLSAVRGAADMRGINLAFADAYRKGRVDDEAAPKTIHLEMTVLRQFVNFSVRRELVDKDRMKGLELKRPKPTPQPCWSLTEVNVILKATIESTYHALFCLLAWTALRIGEAKHLCWEDVDFEQKVLRIRQKWIGPGKTDMWKPKSGDQRAVPLCAAALAVLKSLPRNCRWVFTAAPTTEHPNRDRQIDERRVLYHLKRALTTIGLQGHLHTFRHSLLSHALLSGTPEAVVRKWAGHVDPEVLKLYTHIADPDSKLHMDRLFPQAEGEDRKAAEGDQPRTAGDSGKQPPSDSDSEAAGK